MPDSVDCLHRPRVTDLLRVALQVSAVTVGSMHNVVAPVDRFAHHFLQLWPISLQASSDLLPRILNAQKRSRNVDTALPAQVGETGEPNELVCDEERVRIIKHPDHVIEAEYQPLKLPLNLVVLRDEAPPPEPNDLRQVCPQQRREVRFQRRASTHNSLTQEVAEPGAPDRRTRDLCTFPNEPKEDLVADYHEVFVAAGINQLAERLDPFSFDLRGVVLEQTVDLDQQFGGPNVVLE